GFVHRNANRALGALLETSLQWAEQTGAQRVDANVAQQDEEKFAALIALGLSESGSETMQVGEQAFSTCSLTKTI
ncbi:MAG: hypothetical protein CMJ78_07435, partial [Planctomycetaceae bacterium]|nr:hypothetical protein [Planctomycetaceae bacterium]